MSENSFKILFMTDKRYQLTFTDTTWKIISSLKRTGHDIRDVLNAGIVMFDRADSAGRWDAYRRATSNMPEEVSELERRLAIARKEQSRIIIGPSDGSMEKISEHFGPSDDDTA